MKKILHIFSLILLLFGINNYAQCTQKANSFGNNVSTPMYNVNGDVIVTLNQDNTITLDLGANFTTANGPDVWAYLINSGNLTDNDLQNVLIGNVQNIKLGLVSSSTVNQNGAKTFNIPIPQGIDISKYNKVLFYCLQFNRLWDFGSIEPFSPSNCNVLSNSKFIKKSLSLSPNPAKNSFTIASNSNIELASVKIYDVLGKVVFTKNKNFENAINISTFSEGVYFVEILDTDNNKIIKRLVKSY